MKVEVERLACDFVRELPEKSRRIILNHLYKLQDPEHAPGIERLGNNVFRMHIGRTYTILISILPDRDLVRVTDILPIELARKRYWRFR